MSVFTSDTPPSVARLIAAAQRNETLDVEPVYGSCRASNIEGKGRGLVATSKIEANELLLLEPALAVAEDYGSLAEKLAVLAAGPEGVDATLVEQLLSLSRSGEDPSSVPSIEDLDQDKADLTLRRQPPNRDEEAVAKAKSLLPVEEGSSFEESLKRRLMTAVKANAFRSSPDPLTALAWQALSPNEQTALRERDPSRMPASVVGLFLRASLINHSESPNALWLMAGSVLLVRAAREINVGEEVVMSYWPDIDAADAASLGLYESFGMSQSTVGPAPELEFDESSKAKLLALKASTKTAVTKLSGIGAGSDIQAIFDETAAELGTRIQEAQNDLPKDLPAFIEPRIMQAQLTMLQAAFMKAKDKDRSDKLQKLALLRMRNALSNGPTIWGKRVLLRLIFVLKGMLRPSPIEMLRCHAPEATEEEQQGDYCINLKQAIFEVQDLQEELERAVQSVFGDEALLPALLSKCGIASE